MNYLYGVSSNIGHPFCYSVPPKSGYLSGTFLKSLALDFAIIRSGTGGESIEFPAFPHRTRSGLPVGETDGPRRGPSRQGSGGHAEALLQQVSSAKTKIF